MESRQRASRPRGVKLEEFLRVQLGLVGILTVLERERQVLELRRHPWLAELHWRLTQHLYDLALEEELLLRARARLVGERRRRLEIEPPRRPVAPSEQITQAAAGEWWERKDYRALLASGVMSIRRMEVEG